MTLASLVEKETPVAEDRPLVASVLQNRLAKDMPLMTDPTVIYAAMLEKQYRGTIYQSDLKRDLPITHIAIVACRQDQSTSRWLLVAGGDAPADSHFLYFVADPGDSGHSRFATTLEEHERNVRAYRRGLKDARAGR